jgi:hypothetical protein
MTLRFKSHTIKKNQYTDEYAYGGKVIRGLCGNWYRARNLPYFNAAYVSYGWDIDYWATTWVIKMTDKATGHWVQTTVYLPLPPNAISTDGCYGTEFVSAGTQIQSDANTLTPPVPADTIVDLGLWDKNEHGNPGQCPCASIYSLDQVNILATLVDTSAISSPVAGQPAHITCSASNPYAHPYFLIEDLNGTRTNIQGDDQDITLSNYVFDGNPT